MKVRAAKYSDYAELMKLFSDFVGDSRFSKPGSDSFEQVLNSRSNFVFVAVNDEKLIGFASFSIRSVIRYSTPIAELDELYVDPYFRQHGVGKSLLEEVERLANHQGCRRVYIESGLPRVDAHKFYSAVGYTDYGRVFLKDI